MPLAEKLLWVKIKNRQLRNYKFRRQYGIRKFIVDFYCPEVKLAIEIDGESHFENTQAEMQDIIRQQFIQSMDIRILRFTNAEIYNNLDGVMQVIYNNLP